MISKYSKVYVNDIEDYFAFLIFIDLYWLPNFIETIGQMILF